MKKLIVIPLLGFFIAGCATVPNMQKQSNIRKQPQEVIIKVESVDPAMVTFLDKKENTIGRSMEVSNPYKQLSGLIKLNKDETKAYLCIWSTITISDTRMIRSDFDYLHEETDIRDVEAYINSPGGDAFSGLAIADELNRARGMGFNIVGSTSGIVASAAIPILASFSTRIAAPGTIFMVHEAALWKWPGRETASDIESQNSLMKLIRDRYLTILSDRTKLSKGEWARLENKTTWFCAEEALKWGLVDRIE